MYNVYGVSGPSLLIESTDYDIVISSFLAVFINVTKGESYPELSDTYK